jgi:hypothetical protein
MRDAYYLVHIIWIGLLILAALGVITLKNRGRW